MKGGRGEGGEGGGLGRSSRKMGDIVSSVGGGHRREYGGHVTSSPATITRMWALVHKL